MATNKILFDGVGIDLSSDTVTSAADIRKDKVGHLQDGSVVTGTLEEGSTPTGNINITTMNQTDVSAYATAQVVDADLIASNIKKDVDILGVTGTYEGEGGSVNIKRFTFTSTGDISSQTLIAEDSAFTEHGADENAFVFMRLLSTTYATMTYGVQFAFASNKGIVKTYKSISLYGTSSSTDYIRGSSLLTNSASPLFILQSTGRLYVQAGSSTTTKWHTGTYEIIFGW